MLVYKQNSIGIDLEQEMTVMKIVLFIFIMFIITSLDAGCSKKKVSPCTNGQASLVDYYCGRSTNDFLNNDGKILSCLISFGSQLLDIQLKIFLYLENPWSLPFPMIYRLPFTNFLSSRN